MSQEFPPEFLEFLKSVRGKRSKIVVNHILTYGFITTEELEANYGYKHPPRAVRDVREQGVPIETFIVESSDGRKIAAYRFGKPTEIQQARIGGRRGFSKHFRAGLLVHYGSKCAICGQPLEPHQLQIDHRVPYEISGDSLPQERSFVDYMLVCGSCNRAKSWTCEHCPNFTSRLVDVCQTCYWADPEHYEHVALRRIRRLDIVWTEDELADFEEIRRRAASSNTTLQQYIKVLLVRHSNDTR